jgi:hypothetical protein
MLSGKPVLSSGESIALTTLTVGMRRGLAKRSAIEHIGWVQLPATRPASRFARHRDYTPAREREDRATALPSRPASRFAGRDLAELGRLFARLVDRGGWALWPWAQALLVAFEAQPVPLAEAGKRVGLAAHGRSYSKKWMSRALLAAREWPQRPTTQAEWARFTARFHGHEAKQPGENDPLAVRIQRVLRRLRCAVMAALRLGCTPQDIRQRVDAELLSAVDVQKTAPPPGGGEMRVKA